jgi:hypothetical protein
MSSDKEPNYFSDSPNYSCFYRTEDEYLSLFREAKTKIVGESSTNYLNSLDSAGKIFRFNPEAKILAIFREPTDFLYAYFYRQRYLLNETEEDFVKALKLEEKRKKKTIHSSLRYSERVNFAVHIERFLKIFPLENIKIMYYEDFVKDKQGFYNEIISFLGLENETKINFKNINSNKVARFKLIKKIIEHPIVWKTAKRVINQELYQKLTSIVYKVISKKVKRKILEKSIKIKLKKKYIGNVIELENVLQKYNKLDRDLASFWKYKD